MKHSLFYWVLMGLFPKENKVINICVPKPKINWKPFRYFFHPSFLSQILCPWSILF